MRIQLCAIAVFALVSGTCFAAPRLADGPRSANLGAIPSEASEPFSAEGVFFGTGAATVGAGAGAVFVVSAAIALGLGDVHSPSAGAWALLPLCGAVVGAASGAALWSWLHGRNGLWLGALAGSAAGGVLTVMLVLAQVSPYAPLAGILLIPVGAMLGYEISFAVRGQGITVTPAVAQTREGGGAFGLTGTF